VTIEQSPSQPPIGTGQINIHDGKYSLYGVDLVVNGGRLVFARSPVDNPNLDLSAIRKTDDLVAGAKVLGPLSKPNVTLFADRPMSQTDILAYLVTGKPFDSTSQEESGMLRGAANALGGSAGSLLAREISNRLGIGDFVDISVQNSISQGGISNAYQGGVAGGAGFGSTQGAALFLGKYLTPRIYVQYGMVILQPFLGHPTSLSGHLVLKVPG
jgi:translocation and assembly module TamB